MEGDKDPNSNHKDNEPEEKDVPIVTTGTTPVFPAPDSPTPTPGHGQNGSVSDGVNVKAPLNDLSTTTGPTPKDILKVQKDAPINLTSQDGVLSKASSTYPTKLPESVETTTTSTKTTTPAGKITPQVYEDDPQAHVHSMESNVSTIASAAAALIDHLVVKHVSSTSSTASSSSTSSLQASTTSTPVKPKTTSPLYVQNKPQIDPVIVKSQTSTKPVEAAKGPEHLINIQSSVIANRTIPATQSSIFNATYKSKLDVTLPQFTTTTNVPSTLSSLIVRSETKVLLTSTTSKSLLKSATSTKVSSTTTPKVGSNNTNSNYTTQEEGAGPNTRDMRIPLEKIGVETLSVPVDDSTSGMQGTIAAIVLPIVGLLLILAVVIIIIRRRKGRKNTYKGKTKQDEENSSDITSALVSQDTPNGTSLSSPEEPLYAVVDKSKKRRNTESISVTDETVPLKDFAVTTNGSCPIAQGSEDSLLQESTARDDVEDVFVTEDIPRLNDQPIYDTPPNEDELSENEEENICGEGGYTKDLEKEIQDVVPDGNSVDDIHVGEGQEDLTLVECDIYETADAKESAKDDDSTYEIPDSPATVRARKSMIRQSIRPLSIKVPFRVPGIESSDSESGLDSDFEDLANRHGVSKSEAITGTHEDLNKGLNPPPLPVLLPESSDNDSEYYMSPECHTHCPPGPGWKPFHEYDPVYIPHSDPAGMNRRVDNQNYVRGRQRSDSRLTHPYEEIQFGGIYATVDDEDSPPLTNGQPERPDRKPPLPPPLVPRRTRPISGMADMGRFSIHRSTEADKSQEPRYSGLIKEDLSDPDDETPHEYTPLEYTRLRTQEHGPMIEDDIKLIDDTDSETYSKYAAPPMLKRRSGGEVKDSNANNDKLETSNYCPLMTQDVQESSEQVINQTISDDDMSSSQQTDDSDDSDDSYEPFDFHPPDHTQSSTNTST